MEIEYKGGNCIAITVKKDVLVVDAKLSELGLKDQADKAKIQLATQRNSLASTGEDTLNIDKPGEYEVGSFSITGIAARAHIDKSEVTKSITMYKIQAADITVAVTGHIYPELSEDELESLGVIDVLVVPVGGNGYTLDSHGAVEVVRRISPKIVIPTHFAQTEVKYSVPQQEVADFIKELGTAHETSAKLKLKPGMIGEVLTIHELTRVR